jgi:hypothetical protein
LRKQYHFRPSPNGYYAWDIDRLVSLSAEIKSERVLLASIAEIDEMYWRDDHGGKLTCRFIAEHARLIDIADLSFPIILCSNRRVMDGMHRVLKALNAGMVTIDAVIFNVDPEPDFVDVVPDEVPY